MHEFILAFDTAYPTLERHVIAEKLLPECFDDFESRVEDLLMKCQYSNFTIDELDDKARCGIANLSVSVPSQGSFFLRNYHTQANRQTADFFGCRSHRVLWKLDVSDFYDFHAKQGRFRPNKPTSI